VFPPSADTTGFDHLRLTVYDRDGNEQGSVEFYLLPGADPFAPAVEPVTVAA
jgi:hypothetical protein